MISVQVVDEAQGANRDEARLLSIQPNHHKQPSFSQINQTLQRSIVTFSAHISDAEDDASELSVQWSSALDGDLSLDTNPDTVGRRFRIPYTR